MTDAVMAFAPLEREALLALKGVGPTVVARFEQMGIASFAQLARVDVDHLLAGGASITGSGCWKNSPQARAAITAAIKLARQGSPDA